MPPVLCERDSLLCSFTESGSGSGSDSEQERPRSASNVSGSGSDSERERDEDDDDEGQETGKPSINKVGLFVFRSSKHQSVTSCLLG